MRLGAQPARLEPGSVAATLLRQDGDFRAASPSLRVQQRLPPAIRGPRHAVLRHEPRWLAGRSDRAARASRGSWPCSIIPNSNRSRRRRSRCSPASSARRSPATRAAANGVLRRRQLLKISQPPPARRTRRNEQCLTSSLNPSWKLSSVTPTAARIKRLTSVPPCSLILWKWWTQCRVTSHLRNMLDECGLPTS